MLGDFEQEVVKTDIVRRKVCLSDAVFPEAMASGMNRKVHYAVC